MDAQSPDRPLLAGPAATSLPLGQAEIRSILANLSQELCRRLVSLRAGFDLLLGDAPPEQRGHLGTMVGLCDDLFDLTRSYLDYAGLVQGARPVHYGSYTLGALVRDVDQEFGPAAAARRIDWQCRLEGPDVMVATDASRCQEIFGNLVANALKYTPEGGAACVVARFDGTGWSVAVSDTGPGIPADDRDRVFEPFYRLARDGRSTGGGSGLGLAICRELVEQLGGEIRLGSDEGQGTRVVVRFPAGEPPPSPPAGC